MSRLPTVLVTWTQTEQHQALIPADALARAIGVDPAAFTPAMLTEREQTDALTDLLGEFQDDDSYQHCDTRDVTGARPGPPVPTVDELLAAAETMLDAEYAAGGLSDTGALLEQLVAAIRERTGSPA